MSDRVTRWLRKLGLAQYAESFESSAIEWELLSQLDHDLLKELGVNVLGHRMQIIKAAARLDGVEEPEPAQPTRRAADAERRQLTVMFCDLVGSTELSQRLDPEDLREVNRAYQDTCTAVVERYEGYVARYMGDGVLAYFGYPQAHEDDAERAIRAGLGIVDAMRKLNETTGDRFGVELSVRIGVATGPVVVGDLVGEGASRESAVVGETPNLAARLQSTASPNQVIIGPGTHELIAGRFTFEALGQRTLKGIAEPLHVWRVLAAASAESRFEAAHRTGLTPLVGREHEIGLLLERWSQAAGGEGQVVLLSGEAGIGKSRITEALRERTAGDSPVRLRFQCSPYHTNSALHPIIECLERAARLESGDENPVKLAKLESLLARSTQAPADAVPLAAALLSIPTDERYARLETTPERQKERTLEVLLAQMETFARHGPLLLIFEDAHWADPTSLELLELTVERAQCVPALVIITFRPEFSPPWHGHTHITSLVLNRFTQNLATAMVNRVTNGKPLPEEVQQQIIERTDGVPLFVEELTKTILESGLLSEESDRYTLRGPLSEVAIPVTLHDSLMSRLDRLGAVKEVAQTASAIGREFDYDLLAAVSALSFEKLRDALAQLVDAELVFRRGRSRDGAYIFKHALVQDAAYQSMLKSRRQALHGRLAQVLQSRFPERVESEPELLAHHFTEAGLHEQAIASWREAGLRSLAASAVVEAVSHLQKALELLASLTDHGERGADELSLLVPLVTALTGARGYAAPETGEALSRAHALCRQISDTPQMFPVSYGLWNYRYVGGELASARALAQECLELARHDEQRTRLMAAHGMLGQTLASSGLFDAAQEHVEKSIALYDPQRDGTLWHIYGEDPAMAALPYRHLVSWFKGRPDRALAQSLEAMETTQRQSDVVTAGWALAASSLLRCMRREPEAARQTAQDTIEFATEHKLPVFVAYGTVLRGSALASMGERDKGIDEMQRGLKQWRETGNKLFVPTFLSFIAEAFASSGEFATSLQLLDEACDAVGRSGEANWSAELSRLRGVYLLRGFDDAAAAESAFREAIEIATRQRSPVLELRAWTDLARLPGTPDSSGSTRAHLQAVYERFEEGFGTADLLEAKAVLDGLTWAPPTSAGRAHT